MISKKVLSGAALAFLLSSTAAFATEPLFSGNSLSVKPTSQLSNMTLSVTGPDGFYATEFSKNQAPYIFLQRNGGLQDGLYKWQLTGSTNVLRQSNPMGLDNGRDGTERRLINESMSDFGTFRVVGGVIQQSVDAIEEPDSDLPRLDKPNPRKPNPRERLFIWER